MIIKNIAKEIQEALKAKERAFSRKDPAFLEGSQNLDPTALNYKDLASRTTFVRMISNKKPGSIRIIQGGELGKSIEYGIQGQDTGGDPEKGETAGTGQLLDSAQLVPISETNKTRFGFNQSYSNSRFLPYRPMSGIKDISVEYKGGYKAIREATINWTVFSIEDLDSLTPHFLTIGKTVLLDWGWISKKDPIIKNTFFNQNEEGKFVIDKLVFSNPIPKIIENRGNYDAMGGVISNFEYQLNESGGFDCVTKLISVGANLFENQKVSKNTLSLGKIKDNVNNKEKREAVTDGLLTAIINIDRIIIHNYFGAGSNPGTDNIDAGTSGGNITKTVRRTAYETYQQMIEGDKVKFKELITSQTKPYANAGRGKQFIVGKPVSEETEEVFHDVYITGTTVECDKEGREFDFRSFREDIFVRWGWFEDNILSRYSSFVSETAVNTLVNEFRSIELDYDGEEKPVEAEPYDKTNANHNILLIKIMGDEEFGKGKSSPELTEKRREVWEENFGAQDKTSVVSDGQLKNFPKKSVRIRNNPDYLIPKDPMKFFLPGQNISVKAINTDDIEKYSSEFWNKFLNLNTKKAEWKDPDNSEYGLLRNVMINTKEIKKAFGLSTEKQISVEGKKIESEGSGPVSDVKAGMTALCNLFNDNFFNFWKFRIVEDPHLGMLKVIDEDASFYLKSKLYTTYSNNSHRVQDLGIYKFPTWTLSSMVKNQGLTFKIPQAMAVSAMFGSNKDKRQGLDIDITSEGEEIEALFQDDKDEVYEDQKLKNLQRAYLKGKASDGSHKIGNDKNSSAKPSAEIKMDGSFPINSTSAWWNTFSPDKEDGIEQQKNTDSSNYESKFREELDYILNPIKKRSPAADKIKKEEESRWLEFQYDDDDEQSGFFDPSSTSVQRTQKQQAEDAAQIEGDFRGNSYFFSADADNDWKLSILDPGQSIVLAKLFGNDVKSSVYKTNFVIPAELSLEIDGTGGITPGEIIQTDYIQPKYNKPIVVIPDNKPIGPFTFFQIFGINQKVSSEGWYTELTTKMRINSDVLKLDASKMEEIIDDGIKPGKGPIIPTRDKDNKPPKEDDGDRELPDPDKDLKPGDRDKDPRTERPENPPPDPLPDGEPPLPDTDRDQVPPPPTRPRIPVPSDDEDIAGDLTLDELDFDDFSDLKGPPDPPEEPPIIDEAVIPKTIKGCTNPKAENYNPNATEDDGSCEFPEPPPPPPPVKKAKPKQPPVFIPKADPEIAVLKGVYQLEGQSLTLKLAQNELLYSIREDWRPLYRRTVGPNKGKLTGQRKTKITENGKKVSYENTLVRGGVGKAKRRDFYHKYIEPMNTSGISKVGSSDGPSYTNTGFTVLGETIPDSLIRKHVGGNANPSVDKIYWKGKYFPKAGSTINPDLP